MHKIIVDFDLGTTNANGLKAATIAATDIHDPDFLLRRVVRWPRETIIKKGLLSSSPLPLSKADLNTLFEQKWLISSNLCAWPPQNPILKFTISRFKNLYRLNSIDEKSTDSYFLRTKNWEQVRIALLNISGVTLASPSILDVYNPFSLYAPFDIPPSQTDFELLNNELVGDIEKKLERMRGESCAGFLESKVALQYYQIIADLQRLNMVVGLFSTPSADHFENEHLEF